jgi:hypothetical protein
MRYYEPERRGLRNVDMRIIGLGIVIVILAALVAFLWLRDDDGSSGAGTTPTDSTALDASVTTAVAPTPAPVELVPTVPPVTIDAAALVEDCVQYVPTAVYFGNFYMKAIWDTGGGTPEGLRRVCESMVTSDPAGLQRMSDELHALQAYVATTTTP